MKLKDKIKPEKFEFVYHSLRISFWTMITIHFLENIFSPSDTEFFGGMSIILFWLTTMLFTFVVSIIHLNKYKKKGFAITALVISSIMLLLFLIGFIVGIVNVMN